MAFVEKRGQWCRVVFRHEGRRYTHSLKTQDREIADGILGGVQKTLMLLKQRVLHVPVGADVLDFVLSGGQVQNPPVRATDAPAEGDSKPESPISLQELQTRYAATLEVGSVEANSLETVRMHLRHFVRTLGADFPMPSLSLGDLQGHVARRAKEKGIRNRPLSPTTMRKEMASLRAAWNWGVQAGLLTARSRTRGSSTRRLRRSRRFRRGRRSSVKSNGAALTRWNRRSCGTACSSALARLRSCWRS